MGAESTCGWIRTGTEKDYDWLNESRLPAISPDDLPEGMVEKDWMKGTVCKLPCLDGVEGILWRVAVWTGVKMLKEPGEGWIRFLLDRDGCRSLKRECRWLIREAILVESQEDWDCSQVKEVLGYVDGKWDEEAPEDLCRLLENLVYASKLLDEFQGYDLVVEVAY